MGWKIKGFQRFVQKRHEEIFGKKTPDEIEKENEEYIEELKDKL